MTKQVKQKLEREQGVIITQAYQDYKRKMDSYTFFKISNRETAQDLVQDTFVKTWAYLVKGGKIDLMRPFLYHILNHLIIDEYRKNKTSSLEFLSEKGFEPSFDHSKRTVNILDSKEVVFLIKDLPAKYKKVMEMKYLQGLSLKEMASITGQSKNTVAVQAHRGLAKLKVLYKLDEKNQKK